MVNTNEYCIFTTKPRVRGKKTDAESLRGEKKKKDDGGRRQMSNAAERAEGRRG